jgi:RNA polymerase sigma factor (sigma-70 family)
MNRVGGVHVSAESDEALKEFGRLAYRAAYRVLRSHEDARDTAQDTMVAFLLTRTTVISPGAWFTTTAKNLAVKEAGRTHARLRLEPLLGPSLAHGAEDDAVMHVVAEQLLEALPDREREAVEGLLKGLTRQEIATQMDIGAETVKTHVDRAGAKLRALIIAGGP